MNKLVNLNLLIEENSGEKLLIRPPTVKILKMALIMFTVGFILITVTVNALIAIITVPLLLFWVYFYYLFCKIWKLYKYSNVYLAVLPIIMLILSILARFIFLFVWG